ncbi:uncharacterized protein LOC124711272 [Schistocerca piceifrons]|uniref:uncharacterized protein LOC124711272 n=1 Tax=Schistocerca piceifrons TaxID=274613 RepID=UPI001F5F5443|nr:uncharacterized protein LOC124711272 [Schistocerca piceifrons]
MTFFALVSTLCVNDDSNDPSDSNLMMAYRPPRELRGRIENIRKKFEGGTEISLPPVKPLSRPDICAKKQQKTAGKEAISNLHIKDGASREWVASPQGGGKNREKWDHSNSSTKSHIRRTPAFRCDKNIVAKDFSGGSGKVDNALFNTKVKIFEAEQKENLNTNKSNEISVHTRNTCFNPPRNTFRSRANAVQCVIKTIAELENKKNGDVLLPTSNGRDPVTQSSSHGVKNQQRDQKSGTVSVAELKRHDLDDSIKQQKVNTYTPKPKPKSIDIQSNCNLQGISNTKNTIEPVFSQYECDEVTKQVGDTASESSCKKVEENTVNNKCFKGGVHKRNAPDLSNNCALELTDSLRVALKSPLPQGPPPKKPPRTFAHSPATKSKVQEKVIQFSATKENNASRPVPSKPQRSRTEPLLMLKKLEDALITHQQKGIAVITPRVPSANSTDQDRGTSGSRASVAQSPAVVQPPPVVAETSSVLSNCLSSLNCATNTNLLYCQTHFYEKPAERLSKFFVDVATNRRKLDSEHGLYGTIQKSYSEEHIYAEPFSCSEDQTRNLQQVQMDKCATLGRKQAKPVKTLSASAEHLNSSDSPASHDTLHYMCTPIATDVPPPAVFEAINKDLLSQTIKTGAGSLSKRNRVLSQEHNTEELLVKLEDTERDTVVGKGETGTFSRKQPLLRLATIVRNTASPTPASVSNILRPPDRFKIQLVMNQAFGSPLQGVPTTPVEDDDGELFEKEVPSLGTVSSSSADNNDEKGEHRLKIPTEDPEETPLPNTDLSRLTEERKVYVRRVSSHVSQLTRRAANRYRDSHYTHLFDCALLIGLNLDCEKRVKVPYIKSKYPPQVEVPPMLEHLCFPDALEWPPAPASQNEDQMYSLVITAEDGSRTFGYCRRVMPEGAPICLPLAYCLLSTHRARGFFSKVLQELESRHGQSEWLQTAFIKELFTCEFPLPGQGLRCHSTGKATDTGLVSTVAANLRRPADTRMEDHDLCHLFSALPIHIVLQVFGTALLERKIIFLSSSLSKLSACIEALEAMLYPFSWQYTFITILPSSKLEVCEAPTPYIIGVLKGKEGSKPDIKMDEGVIVDLDEGRLCCSVGDESTILPTRLRRCLKVALQLVTAQESDASRNVLISEAFLRMFVEVCGHYQTYIVTQQDGRRMFERESFIKAVQSRSVQMFLEWFTETAMFSEFITTRVEQQSEAKGMFEQRVAEHIEEMEKNTVLFLRNYKGINKKVKTFVVDIVHAMEKSNLTKEQHMTLRRARKLKKWETMSKKKWVEIRNTFEPPTFSQ